MGLDGRLQKDQVAKIESGRVPREVGGQTA